MIVKVQLSLATTADERMALIYDEDRANVYVELPVSQLDGLEEAMGDSPKAFFEVDVIEHLDPGCVRVHAATVLHRRDCTCTKQLIIGKKLADQGW